MYEKQRSTGNRKEMAGSRDGDTAKKNRSGGSALMAFFTILRPFMSFIAAIVSTTIYYATVSNHAIGDATFIFAVVYLTSCFAFVLNDVFDFEKDKLYHRHRALPRGLIQPRAATIYAIALGVISLLLSSLLSGLVFWINLATIALLTVYSKINNKYGIWANAITSAIGAYVVVIGMAAGQFRSDIIIMSGVVFLLMFGREIILDIRDVAADKRVNKTSFPIRFGTNGALWASTIFFMLVTALTAALCVYTKDIAFITFVGFAANIILWVSFLYYVKLQTKRRLEVFLVSTRLSFLLLIPGILL